MRTILSLIFLTIFLSPGTIFALEDLSKVDITKLRQLNGEEIFDIITNKEAFGYYQIENQKLQFTEIHYLDELKYKIEVWFEGKAEKETGLWKINGNNLCYKLDKSNTYEGDEEFDCGTVMYSQNDISYYFFTEGESYPFARTTSYLNVSSAKTLPSGKTSFTKSDAINSLDSISSENLNNDASNLRTELESLFSWLEIYEYQIDTLNNSKIILKNINKTKYQDSLNIGEIRIIGANNHYLKNLLEKDNDISYKGRIFQELVINDIVFKLENDLELRIETIAINNFDLKKIDLLRYILSSDYKPSDFFYMLDSISIDDIAMINFEIFNNNSYASWHASLKSLLINNLSQSSIEKITLNDLEVDEPTQFQKTTKFEINNLKFNRPSNYADFVDGDFDDPSGLFLFFDSVDEITTLDSYQEIKTIDYILEIEESKLENFKTKKINGLSIPISLEIMNRGIQISSNNYIFKSTLRELGYYELKFNAGLSLDWNTDNNIFSFYSNFGMQDGFDLSIDAKIIDLDENLTNLYMYSNFTDQLMNEVKFKKLQISLYDRGITNRILDFGASNYGITRKDFTNMTIYELQNNIPIGNSLKNELLASVINFLNQPNKIILSIDPKNGLSYSDILHLSSNPNLLTDLLNISIK